MTTPTEFSSRCREAVLDYAVILSDGHVWGLPSVIVIQDDDTSEILYFAGELNITEAVEAILALDNDTKPEPKDVFDHYHNLITKASQNAMLLILNYNLSLEQAKWLVWGGFIKGDDRDGIHAVNSAFGRALNREYFASAIAGMPAVISGNHDEIEAEPEPADRWQMPPFSIN